MRARSLVAGSALALLASLLAGACVGAVEPATPNATAARPAPVASSPTAPPSVDPGAESADGSVPEHELPLVTWPAPVASPELAAPPPVSPPPRGSEAPPPPAKPWAADPGVKASIDAPIPASEPLRAPSDLERREGKLAARQPRPPAVRSSGVEVRGSGGSPPRASARPPSGASGHMWGDEVGDAFGAGGLGLAGVGEGGGGKGEGIGLGSVGTIGHGAGSGTGTGFGSGAGRVAPRPSPSSSGRADAQARGVAAGEWDDNANFLDFRRYLAREASRLPYHRVDLSSRRFLVVRDAEGKPVPSCPITVEAAGRSVTLLTTSTGRAILFPHAEGVVAPRVTATARCGAAGEATASFAVDAVDGAVDLHLAGKRALPARPTIDVTFVLDTTGSMSEEIDGVKRAVRTVAARLAGKNLAVRFALVEYKDRGDDPPIRVHHMTRDASGFVERIARVQASGGGDMPEDVIEGLHAGLTEVAWSRGSAVRLAFLIGDAPPQLGYGQGSYVDAMRAASRAGIVLHTVAASGMDDIGQAVWRQIAQYTGGSNLFVLRGGAGPQSTGAGDARSSCGDTHSNYTSGNLDVLIAEKVERAVAALEADPMQIAGLGQDERARPCAQRVSQR